MLGILRCQQLCIDIQFHWIIMYYCVDFPRKNSVTLFWEESGLHRISWGWHFGGHCGLFGGWSGWFGSNPDCRITLWVQLVVYDFGVSLVFVCLHFVALILIFRRAYWTPCLPHFTGDIFAFYRGDKEKTIYIYIIWLYYMTSGARLRSLYNCQTHHFVLLLKIESIDNLGDERNHMRRWWFVDTL